MRHGWRDNPQWGVDVEAASRCFCTIEDYKILFHAITDRIRNTPVSKARRPFPIQAARAICRVLGYRKEVPEALTGTQAKLITEQSVLIMETEAAKKAFKSLFFQGSRLFVFLLRFRLSDDSFLNPENPQDSDLFQRTLKCLRAAKNHFKGQCDTKTQKAQELLSEIEAYMHYEGSKDIIHLLEEFTEDTL
jgi:hypothetical protein